MLNIFVYGNCQSKGIIYCLSKVLEANFIHIINYEYIWENKNLPIDDIKNADVFIYQPTKAKHGIYSTDTDVKGNVCSHLKPSCIKIAFPYIYNYAFWPFVPESDHFKGIEPIIKLKKGGHSLETITNMFLNEEIDFDYEKKFNKCISILREKEKLCDVKVSDFICANAQNIKLFLTQNHPTTHVYIHCTNQILKLLGIKKVIENDAPYPLNLVDLPGNYLHTTHDLKFWKFKYPVMCCNFGWIEKLKNVYNSIKD